MDAAFFGAARRAGLSEPAARQVHPNRSSKGRPLSFHMATTLQEIGQETHLLK